MTNAARALLAPLFFLLLAGAYWKLRILDTASIAFLGLPIGDLFIEHYPMKVYGFTELLRGHLPLWNPYQLGGIPFLAVPHTGLFYPGNLPYLLTDTAIAIEVSLLLHLALAGTGMWALLRVFGLSSVAGVAGALTMMFAGYVTWPQILNQPAILSVITWFPVCSLLLVQVCRRGLRWAPWLAIALLCQLMAGAHEYLIYNAYAYSILAGFEISSIVARDGFRPGVRAVGVLILACVIAVLLGAPQLLPSLELVANSARAPGRLAIEEALAANNSAPISVIYDAAAGSGRTFCGLLPLIGLLLGALNSRTRYLWAYATTLCAIGLAIAAGGTIYELYFESPLGGLFRRPVKLLQLYCFGAAILSGIGVESLLRGVGPGDGEGQRLRAWGRLGAPMLALGAVAILLPPPTWALICTAALIGLIGLLRVAGGARKGLVLLLVGVHGVSLFLGAANDHLRPIQQRAQLAQGGETFAIAARAARGDRILLSSYITLFWNPALSPKQGMLRQLRMVGDYEALITRRQAEFLERAIDRPGYRRRYTPEQKPRPAEGSIDIGSAFSVDLLDLMSTRAYAVSPIELARGLLDQLASRSAGAEFTKVADRPVSIYERPSALSRAYVVHRARLSESPEGTLEILQSPDFDRRREVVLEEVAEVDLPTGEIDSTPGHATITVDEPERVAVEVRSNGDGYLVLTDTHYPGWEAFVDGDPASIERANYLFRAVRVPAGESLVEFVYRPASLRNGLRLAILGAVLLAGTLLWSRRRATASAGGRAT